MTNKFAPADLPAEERETPVEAYRYVSQALWHVQQMVKPECDLNVHAAQALLEKAEAILDMTPTTQGDPLPAEDRAVTQPSDLARLRQAVFGGADRSSWSIEQVIALAQAHRQDSQLMDAKQDAEDRAVTAPQEPEIQGLRDMLRLQMSLKDDYLRLADKYGEQLTAFTHAIEALRGEMEQAYALWMEDAYVEQPQLDALRTWAAILKEWEGR